MRSFDLIIFSPCVSCYVFTVPRLLEEGLLRIKPPGTRIFWVPQPPFAQPSLVDPQLENPFASGFSETLAQANPQPADPQWGKHCT